MPRIILLTFCLLACLFCGVVPAFPQQILVVQNLRIKPYADALAGFKESLGARGRHVAVTVNNGEDIVSSIRKKRPDLILAIGMDSLQKVKRYTDIPIVYLMVLNASSVVQDERNVNGVGMTIAPERQIAQIRKVLPNTRKIGLLYDPKKSSFFVRRAQAVAREHRIDLLVKEVDNPKSVSGALNNMKGAVEALWMIPDTSVVTPETAELIMLFSLENRLPVVTFSTKYLEMGAFMSLDVNAFDMGKQAGEQAARILAGMDAGEVPASEAESLVLTINEAVARKLRISIPEDVRARARMIQ
jgi:putative ABC transport system substrate-binding protein